MALSVAQGARLWLLASALLLALACGRVSGQAYVPLVSPVQASACGGTATQVKVGNDAAAQFSVVTLSSTLVYLSLYNNSAYGAQLNQLTLQLADNSNLRTVVHLRMGVYSAQTAVVVGDYGSSLQTAFTLVAQTDEITLFPSAAQTLYANLQSPAALVLPGQYALAVSADAAFSVYGGGSSESYALYSQYYTYIDVALPAMLTRSASLFGPVAPFASQTAQAAVGCRDPAVTGSASSRYYGFCAVVEQYAVSTSSTDFTQAAVTSTYAFSGLLTASASATSTSFGSGLQVQSVVGALTLTSSSTFFDYPTLSTQQLQFTQLVGSNKVKGVAPSNLVYPAGSSALLDSNGLALSVTCVDQCLTSALELVLQWNPTTRQYQITNSTTSIPNSAVFVSNVTLTPLTSASHSTEGDCTVALPQVYAAPAVPACPAGSLAISLGDNSADLTGVDALEYDYATVYGNTLYFYPFAVPANGTVINSLSTFLLPNPNTVVHVRLGLYALVGSIYAPSWTLLGQAAEQVLANPANAAVTAPLPTAVTVNVGTYAVGVLFDVPVFAYWDLWEGSPSLTQQYLAYRAITALPASSTSLSVAYFMPSAAASGCIPGVNSTVAFFFCAAFSTGATTSDVFSGVVQALPTQSKNAFGTYWTIVGVNGSETSNSDYYGSDDY